MPQEAKQDISKQTSSVGWMVQLHGLTDSRPRFILDGKFLQQQSVLPGPCMCFNLKFPVYFRPPSPSMRETGEGACKHILDETSLQRKLGSLEENQAVPRAARPRFSFGLFGLFRYTCASDGE